MESGKIRKTTVSAYLNPAQLRHSYIIKWNVRKGPNSKKEKSFTGWKYFYKQISKKSQGQVELREENEKKRGKETKYSSCRFRNNKEAEENEQEKRTQRIYGYGRVQETPLGLRRNFTDKEV